MRWVLEDYTLCIYIIYISEHYVNKLEALVLVLLFRGRSGDYIYVLPTKFIYVY